MRVNQNLPWLILPFRLEWLSLHGGGRVASDVSHWRLAVSLGN